MKRAGAVLALVAGLAAFSAAAAPRVASLDQCADQYVLALSPRARIVGLSPRALNEDSYLRARARGLPIVRATLESLLLRGPQVVVRSWGGSPELLRELADRGVRIVPLDDAANFPGVARNIRRVASALETHSAGEALIDRMNATLAAASDAWGGRRALYLTPGGATSGKGTLIDAMLAAAGLRNAATGEGYREVSLESLAVRPPDALVLGFFDPALLARQPWSLGRHRVIRRLAARKALVSLPAAELGCPGWFAADAALATSRARKGA